MKNTTKKENKCPFLAKSVSVVALTLIVSWTIVACATISDTPVKLTGLGEKCSLKPPVSDTYTRSQYVQ